MRPKQYLGQITMTFESYPSYSDLNEELLQAGIEQDAAECHGLITGFLASGELNTKEPNLNLLFTDLDANYSLSPFQQENLGQLIRATESQLSDLNFEFKLFLPDDNAPIEYRIECLGHWCEGFLAAIGMSGINIENIDDPDFKEAISDLIEITRLSAEDTAEKEENEVAYFEIAEYVRIAALLIYSVLNKNDTHHKNETNKNLH